MTQNEVVKFWKESSDKDWEFSMELYESGKRYDYALFFVHLSLEKLLKALHYHLKNDHPLAIHDLVELAKRTGQEFSEENLADLKEMTSYNLSARYDDYKKNFYKKATKEYTDIWFRKAIKIRKLLLSFFEL
ncbi:HEPN domain-containing protein [Candidatus Amesbacteria bacterium]|nr:HEPN domain-containing protein [Candidatus Amesbacteria bacterium]